MTPRRMTSAAALTVSGLALATGMAEAAEAPQARGATLHVAVNGNDRAGGSQSAPLRTIQAAIDKAAPGTTIRVHRGTYSQQLRIRKSGTASAPITITNAGDGTVTVTSSQRPDACNSRQPSFSRTILVQNGADHWTFSGLNLVHGAFIAGKGANKTYSWHAKLAKSGNWAPRRAVPGTSRNDPAGARGAVSYLARKLGTQLDPSDGIKFIGNTITGRGIYATLSGNGVIQNNRISNIICGSGPAIWVMNFSNFWTMSGNDISKVAASTAAHFMQEGIRLGSASNYNTVTRNKVHDLPGDGRAFNTDVDSSWNVFSNNSATNVSIGYNDQMAGWGNRWENNTVSRYRMYGIGFRLMDAKLAKPSLNSSTNKAVVTGIVATNPASSRAKALGVGAIMGSTFRSNTLPSVWMGKNVWNYWGAQGNTWNGSSRPPAR